MQRLKRTRLFGSSFNDTLRHTKNDLPPRQLLEDMGIMEHEPRLFGKLGMSVSQDLDDLPNFPPGQVVGCIRKALEELYVYPNSCVASLEAFLSKHTSTLRDYLEMASIEATRLPSARKLSSEKDVISYFPKFIESVEL